MLIRHSAVEHRRVKYSSCAKGVAKSRVRVGEIVGKIGEGDEMGERELVLVVSVKCGKNETWSSGLMWATALPPFMNTVSVPSIFGARSDD